MKKLVITAELALTLQLLEDRDRGMFIGALLEYVSGVRGLDPDDYPFYCSRALKFWFAHIDDITITEV